MEKSLYRKGLVAGIMVIFLGVSIVSSTANIDKAVSSTTGFSGNLTGYINNTSGNPIKGAIVRVFFHDTWRKDYSDEKGYYNVTKIPICFCIKETYCSKIGYKTEHVSLAIVENTIHNFILTSTGEKSKNYNGLCKIRNKAIDYPIFLMFLEQFPILQQLFQGLYSQ